MKRLMYYMMSYPMVVRRWLKHFGWLILPNKIYNAFPPESKREWFYDLFFYTIDLIFLPFWYESIFTILKKSVRPLTEEEIKEAKQIFGSSIDYDLVRVDIKPHVGLGKNVVAYVTFFLINYKRKISMPIMMHELVHVWQYKQFGSVYIAKALKAQVSREGYDYGGMENLYHQMLRGKTLTSFNFEQQAEIIEDYYRIRNNRNTSPMFDNVYGYYVGFVKV